jgi:hypothetical protein
MRLVDQTSLAEIALPNDLLWVDEFKWTPVSSTGSYSLAGSLIIEQGVKLAGRPITLEPPELEMAWVSRTTVHALKEAASLPDRKFKLLLEYPTDSREFLVVFAPDTDPIEASPVKGFPGHADGDWFRVSLKLIEVAL